MVRERWNFMTIDISAVSYMLTPQHAAEGFYIDNNKIDLLRYTHNFVETRHPGFGDMAEAEAAQFMSDITTRQVKHVNQH